MAAVSPQGDERARKNLAAILQGLASAGQSQVAQALGVSESSVSRMKDGDLAQLAKLMAVCGLKVVPEKYKCVDPEYLGAILMLAKKHMDQLGGPSQLTWDD